MSRGLLISGANGFVGQALIRAATRRGWSVRAATRTGQPVLEEASSLAVGDLSDRTDWSAALSGCDAVVHLAARVHMLGAAHDEAAFHRVNVAATVHLARSAAAAGVRRLVFISTVKVLGEGQVQPYTDGDVPAPEDAYARSKYEAEQRLFEIAAETGLEVVVLRPPLVYGPGVKANFLNLIETVARGWPLPLGALKTRRSFCYVENLVDAIVIALDHPSAAGQRFLVADEETWPLPDMIKQLGLALGRPARLIPVPVRILRLLGALAGRRDWVHRLTDTLEVDASGISATLGWRPPCSVKEGIKATADDYRSRHGL
jgi:nucleoside-diphosphate-sugar epimerase